MFPLTEEHRDIEIRYGYDITTDSWRANFVLPAKQTMRVDFHRTGFRKPMSTLDPGKNSVSGATEGEALERARAEIDSYLVDA
ncbi:hypothetical protein [Dyella sp. A6]|uniref:hypothetical protein n=1 Tax=Dyella aluminiiresistens TaxID=3069105 RepID=UPI002E79A75C|nr:hypothetical protein [Dyella sp. A6]